MVLDAPPFLFNTETIETMTKTQKDSIKVQKITVVRVNGTTYRTPHTASRAWAAKAYDRWLRRTVLDGALYTFPPNFDAGARDYQRKFYEKACRRSLPIFKTLFQY